MTFEWIKSSLPELEKSYKLFSLEDYTIKTYKGKVRIFRAKRSGWIFSKKLPLYILIETNGSKDEAGLHYYERGFIFCVKTDKYKTQGIVKEDFKECLSRSGLDSFEFFSSLDELVEEEEKKTLEKLLRILNPHYISKGKISAQTRIEPEKTE